MNSNRFRLVYSQCLGMFVPVSETTMARGRKSSGKRMRSRYAVAAALFSIANTYDAIAAPPVTVPPPAVNALPTNGVVTSGAATINIPANTSAMTVNQTTQNAIINWGSFNIGSQASINFAQPNSTSAVLNRVSATGGLSQIYGKLTADGQVYLINPNGILFGQGSTVNVNSLVASSLNISDDLFNKGYLSITDGAPAFNGTTGYIQVNAGAEINAATGGKVLMFAPDIKNNGLIKTPDGQTLLAAGQKVYLTASNDINLRGLLVEVDNGGTVNNGFTELDENNKPINEKVNLGQIIAERGNVTLAGIAVNQNGRIKATTSVTANGSIRLQARDGIDINQLPNLKGTNGGEVVLGENSLTEVTAELGNKTRVPDTVDVKKSVVDISGKTIHFDKNAWVVAAGGEVTVSAGVNPSTPALFGIDSAASSNNSRIYFEGGSGIDVSGVGSGSVAPNRADEKAEQLSVASNVVVAELRGTELADSPLQRKGILYKAKVYVDSQLTGLNGNVGTSVANVGGYVAQIGHNLGERLAAGGKVKIQSEGDIVMAPNATINVSGGKVDYLAGTVNKTRLLASNGQIYDIANASKDLTYVGIQNVSVQQQGYTQGKDAGSITFSAPAMVLEGKLKGDTVAGARQRTLATLPKGATLEIGQKFLNGLLLSQTNVLHSDIVFDGLSHTTSVPIFLDSLTNDQKQTLHLGTNFTPSSFSNLRYYADGQITVKKDVNLETKVGGNLVLNAGGVDVQGNLTSHSGTIEVAAKQKSAYIGLNQDNNFKNNITQNVEISANTVLDVSGLWVNDRQNAAATDVIASNGGKVNISATANIGGGNITLKKGGSINASGGAWLNSSGKLSSGKGGDISLKAGAGYADEEAHKGKLVLDGTLRADSLSTGGSLQLSSGSVTIGTKASPTANGELLLNPEFFRSGGFNSYTVNSYEGLTLQENTSLAPVAHTRILDSGYAVQDTGADITKFSHLSLLPLTNAAITRKATNLSLSATTETFGDLTLELGSRIEADPSAKLNFFARNQLTALGIVSAPAGTISMAVGREPQETDLVKYLDNQTLWLGSNSVLDVSGIADSYVNANGLRIGTIKDAGNIVLDAKQGVVVAESGAKLNLSGTHALLDVKSGNNSYTTKDVASRGGNLSISAREGVLMDASIDAHGGSNTVAAGSYDLNLYESGNTITGVTSYPTGSREIVLKKSGKVVPTGLVKGGAIDSALNGKAYVAVDSINQAGFDSVSLASPNNIRMTENATLITRGAIKLETPNIVADKDSRLSLNASFVSIGNSQPVFQNTGYVNTPETGTGVLNVTADNIELVGQQNLSGIASANFSSKGDIQLKGILPSDVNVLTPKGNVKTAGNLNFTAGRIFPTTLSDYTLSSIGEKATIAFSKTEGAETGVPFSVLAKLNVEAANINQNGLLRAPFGVISLKASDKLTLEDGSITSVSADGKTLPFGTTTNEASWEFNLGDRSTTFTSLPDKAVNLDGKVVEFKVGSKVDVSGGGDLTAYEFTAGTGGSDDVLAADGVFAVMPNSKAGYMAGNSESFSSGALKAGDSIYLSGGNGLAAGNYVLLPAHYALLPGGYSVKAVAGTQDFSAQQNVVNKDGSMLVSGYRTQFGGITADSRNSGFLVASGNIARTQSEYSSTLAGKYFKNTDSTLSGLRLPADAGRVAISALTNLTLDGTLVTNHAALARGAAVDISSDKIAISVDGTQEAGTGYLKLSSEKLNAIGAESLTIGAKTSGTEDGTQLDVIASNVKLIGGAKLTGQEITLAATDTVSMASGTSVTATGAATKNSSTLIIGNADIAGSGDGALLRVSTGAQPDLVRKNVPQTKGTLDIQTGAKVAATGSIIADATKANTFNGDITLAKDGAIRLGAQKIIFGSAPTSVTGLLLDNSKLAALGSPSNIQLKSYSTIDFYGTTAVGNTNLKSLTFESAGLAGFNNANQTVTLTADTVKFANPDGKAFAPTGTLGIGTLEVNAGKAIELDKGTFSTAGFKTVNIKADQVIGEAKGTLDVNGDLNIDAARITAAGLSDQTIKASGNLSTTQHNVAGLAPAPLGGKLTLAANTITHGGIIDLPSGIVTIKAAGKAGDDSLTLLEGSQINAKGSAQLLGTVAALADGGTINLQTANGNVKMEKGAIIDVSATGGAGAGAVVINTAGIAKLNGTFNGVAIAGNGVTTPKQGSIDLSANTLTNFAALNTELERGKFNESRNIHVAQGDLTLDDTMTAHKVTLTTDDGDLNIDGKIDASGDKGGVVNLNAGQLANDGKGNINLASTAKIDAFAKFVATETAGSKGDGGKVTLNTTTDSDTTPANGSRITAVAGNEINVSKGVDKNGVGLGRDGKVTLRAPRLGMANVTDAGNDIAITEFKSTIKGANASIVTEGVKAYQPADGVINNAFVSAMKADNTNFLANSDAIKSKLGLDNDTRFILVSGNEVSSTGNITVADDINLQAEGPGALTLRAKGDINVNSSISAGFTTAKTTGTLTTGGAWTYRIAAGADMNSADVLATNNAGTGNFTLAADKLIRTGTGDIEIATGNNFNLGSIASAIYTAGEKDIKDYSALGTFVNPPKVANASAVFAVNGGDITLVSKGSMTGISTGLDDFGSVIYQLPADWLNRSGQVFNKAGNLSRSTTWWPSYGAFKQSIGALAGGDVNIASGGDITNLSAVVATNGRVFRLSPTSSTLVVNGGGDLTVKAAGNISGGLYMVDKGVANISGGSLTANANDINTAVALGDASINVATRGQLDLLTAFNPLATKLSVANLNSINNNEVYFTTYAADSAVKLTSLSSGVTITNNTSSLTNDLKDSTSGGEELLKLLPSTLNIAALGGDANISGSLAMLPSAHGDLQLAASGSIKFENNAQLAMSDVDPASLPTALTPTSNSNVLANLLTVGEGKIYHSANQLHANDSQPVVLYAGKDITGTLNGDVISLTIPKKATIFAEHDIRDFSIKGQNLKASDVTSISAGNDFVFSSSIANNKPLGNASRIDWGGSGYLDIAAGRDVNLNNAFGITTSGNLRNPYLPELGASMSVLAGASNADDAQFIAKYLDPAKDKSYSSKLTSFVNKVNGISDEEIIKDEAIINNPKATVEAKNKALEAKALREAKAWVQFQAMNAPLQRQFVQSSFFNELKQAGIDHNDPKSSGFSNYKRGYDAIATYFPNNNYQGNIEIAFSQIKTLRGGDLNLMVPGGSAVIGLPKIPPLVIQAKDDGTTTYDDLPSLLGLVTVNGGNINVFAKNNIDVAQSREFTLAGGDILNWSTLGDIDAGKGAKTATSAPPPLVRTDDKGNTVLDLAGVVSGSGIGTLQTVPNAPAGDVTLIAPEGSVNAGDAGIRSAGNLLIAATRVLGADNIQVGGTSSGVPAVNTVNISFNAPASADSNAASKQGDQLGTADKLGENSKMANLLSLINVEVISLGDESAPTTKNCAVEKAKDIKNKKDCQP